MEQLAESKANPKFNLNIIDAIYARRSVRQYTDRKVSTQAIEELVNAAIQAPSAMNSQPWAFVVIQDKAMLTRICEQSKDFLMKSGLWKEHSGPAVEPFLGAHFDIFYGATTMIVLCSEREGFQPLGDCYLAAENLMLAAMAMGLGTCPIGFARDALNSDSLRKELAIPANYDPILPIAVGYPSGQTEATPRNPPKIFKWLTDANPQVPGVH